MRTRALAAVSRSRSLSLRCIVVQRGDELVSRPPFWLQVCGRRSNRDLWFLRVCRLLRLRFPLEFPRESGLSRMFAAETL